MRVVGRLVDHLKGHPVDGKGIRRKLSEDGAPDPAHRRRIHLDELPLVERVEHDIEACGERLRRHPLQIDKGVAGLSVGCVRGAADDGFHCGLLIGRLRPRGCRARAPVRKRLCNPAADAHVLHAAACQANPVIRVEQAISHVERSDVDTTPK